MKTIYFVRHGESQSNIDKVYAGSRLDTPLTSKGLEQADLVAEVLKNKKFDLIVSSPLRRTKSTAERIAQKLGYMDEIILESLLAERDFGEASGKPWAEVDADVDSGEIEGLETIQELAERMQRLLDWFKTLPGEHIIVVGHGTAEIMLQAVYSGKAPATFLDIKELDNAEVREYLLQ